MTTYTTKPLAVSVFQEGESPVFSDTAFHVSVEDHAAGPFIKILGVKLGRHIERLNCFGRIGSER